jgi:hypothetical protein
VRVVGSSVLTNRVSVRWLWRWFFLGWRGLGGGALGELAGLSVRFRWRSIFLAGRQKGHAGRVRSMGGFAFGVVGVGRWINRKSVAGQNLVVD